MAKSSSQKPSTTEPNVPKKTDFSPSVFLVPPKIGNVIAASTGKSAIRELSVINAELKLPGLPLGAKEWATLNLPPQWFILGF